MKVLEEGKWNRAWVPIEVVCKGNECGAKLLVEESDVKPIDYSSKNDFFAVCAVCGSHMSIDLSSMSLRMQRELNSKRKYRCSSD